MDLFLLLGQTAAENDDGFDTSLAFFLTGFFGMIGIVICVAVWQVMSTWRARMSIAREDGYRRVAEDSESTNSRTADLLASIRNDLADLRTRTAELERIMKEVE
jgi:hypothetical protein